MGDEITYPFPNFNGFSVEVWEWIKNFIPHFIIDVITYPCWDQSKSVLEKGTLKHKDLFIQLDTLNAMVEVNMATKGIDLIISYNVL